MRILQGLPPHRAALDDRVGDCGQDLAEEAEDVGVGLSWGVPGLPCSKSFLRELSDCGHGRSIINN